MTQHADDGEAYELLVESSLLHLFEAIDEALRDGISEPVVFLVDCEDALGAEIAEAWMGDDAVDNAIGIAQMTREDDTETTVLTRAVSIADCRREVPAVFPYLASALEKNPPNGEFFVICVTDGGAAVLSVPKTARE